MKKEVKVHLIYASIFVFAMFMMFFYQQSQHEQTRFQLQSQAQQLQNQIQDLEQDIDTQVSALEEKDKSLESNVKGIESNVAGISTTLEAKDQEIKILSGEIQDVQSRNAKLEDSVSNLKIENQDFSDVIENAVPAVVSIRTDKAIGTGFIVDTDGTIVTNYHVMQGANAAVIETTDGRKHAVAILGYNEDADVAVLKIEASGLRRLRFGNSDDVRVGQKMIAVGSPSGLDFSVTQGIVSATKRRNGERELIQIDVPINPGNSGGPLLNAEGKVMGVNTLKIEGTEGLGFALSSNYVQIIVDDILSGLE